MNMSLSVTGWAVDPDLLSDIKYELVHSEQFGDCFRIKMEFKNGTDALLEIDIKDGSGLNTYDMLTEAIRCPRMSPLISGSAEPS
jgi:hypothetical protein